MIINLTSVERGLGSAERVRGNAVTDTAVAAGVQTSSLATTVSWTSQQSCEVSPFQLMKLTLGTLLNQVTPDSRPGGLLFKGLSASPRPP